MGGLSVSVSKPLSPISHHKQHFFFAITKSLMHLSDQDFQTLCDAICRHFLPALFQGSSISNDDEEFLFLQVCLTDSTQNSYYCIPFFKAGHIIGARIC